MKKSVKILLIVISLVLVLTALTGCGNNEVNNNQSELNNTSNQSGRETLTRGTIDENNVYNNGYADITFKLPDGWAFATDEQIADMMNVAVEMLDSENGNLAEVIEETGLYDMVANDQTNGTSVMVMFEKSMLNVNEEYYLNNVKNGLEAVTEFSYQVSDEITTQTVGGREYKVLTAEVPEYNMVQKYYVEKKDNYFIDILITYIDGVADLDSILANFQ